MVLGCARVFDWFLLLHFSDDDIESILDKASVNVKLTVEIAFRKWKRDVMAVKGECMTGHVSNQIF